MKRIKKGIEKKNVPILMCTCLSALYRHSDFDRIDFPLTTHILYTHTHTHNVFPFFFPVFFLALSSVYVREEKKLESIERSMRRIVEIDD